MCDVASVASGCLSILRLIFVFKESQIEWNTKIISHKQIFRCMLPYVVVLVYFSLLLFFYSLVSSSSSPYTDSVAVAAIHRTLPVCVWACVCCHCWKLSENWEFVCALNVWGLWAFLGSLVCLHVFIIYVYIFFFFFFFFSS